MRHNNLHTMLAFGYLKSHGTLIEDRFFNEKYTTVSGTTALTSVEGVDRQNPNASVKNKPSRVGFEKDSLVEFE